jgi:biopolymer transport protein ExbD
VTFLHYAPYTTKSNPDSMAQLTAATGRGIRRAPHLDMTPMVDLAFLLLTFFVLTMTIHEEHVLKMQMPDEDTTEKHPEVNRDGVLTVLLGEANKVYYFQGSESVQTTDYGPTGIRMILKESMVKRHDLVVLIKPTAQSRYQNLIDIMDEIRINGLERYYLVEETAEDRALIQNRPSLP